MTGAHVTDLPVVALVLACAIGFLVRGFVRGRPPPCHPARSSSASSSSAGGDVIVGASLARGLERAKQRRS